MATGAIEQVVGYLRRVTRPQEAAAVTDGQLLRTFLADRGEAAFELLVRRHGSMVLGVCRRILGNLHDAEDAFQVTFLVLARKGGSIVPREQVGNWLHGVALRTALEARARRARRRTRELQVMDMPHPTVSAEVNWEALHRILDQELERLPVKYRSAIVLCDLEGRSRKEAARQLGLAEGTLSSRLATGRQMLVRRLARHGLTLPAAGLVAALGAQTARAAVSPALVSATAKAVMLAASGQAGGLFSAQVLSLSQGVLKTMLLQRLKVVSVLLLGIALGTYGVGSLVVPAQGQVVLSGAPRPVAQAAHGQQAEPEEPLEASWLLNEPIQKELRLSPGQVKWLKDIAAESEQRDAGVRKQIEELQNQIAQLQNQAQSLEKKIANDREQALRDAAPKTISPRAIARLRQIQRQYRRPEDLLKSAKMQRLLNLNDEQLMKIESVLKEAPFDRRHDLFVSSVAYANFFSVNRHEDPKALAKLAETLTLEQRRTLRAWLGEPYNAAKNWSWLWPEAAHKDR
jgi:RNA polymerase sigma factor (sigma-70 family)